MLIVTRRKGQRIVLGNDIEIVITDISRSGVKVGIVAPSSLTILRGEVKDAVEQANREALESSFTVPPIATPSAESSSAAPSEAAGSSTSPSAAAVTAQPALSER
ncbi:MAG TPA: carbon storage regulator [Polyangiaceae bacterium]|nr:carbon storage regulator [Polyangiaceae bacterium]